MTLETEHEQRDLDGELVIYVAGNVEAGERVDPAEPVANRVLMHAETL
jgi:hypothetical protein